MLIVITGGAGSGKSEYAEGQIVQSGNPARYYLATMKLWDEECRARASRHREMRRGKGFSTLECPENLPSAALQLPPGGAVLLEDLTNLATNEWYSALEREDMLARVLYGLEQVNARAELFVVVTNELFSDGRAYDQETERFLLAMAKLNRAVAKRADRVLEIVCGIPIVWKGERV